MSKGMIVTDGVDYSNAQDIDIVVDSRLVGGMKINKKYFINPATDMQLDTATGFYYGQQSHGLTFVPGVIPIQNGAIGSGWQNSALIVQSSASADETNIYYQCADTTTLCIVVFGEKVSDS